MMGYFYEVPIGSIKKKPMLHPVHAGHGLANTKRVWYGYRFGIVAGKNKKIYWFLIISLFWFIFIFWIIDWFPDLTKTGFLYSIN